METRSGEGPEAVRAYQFYGLELSGRGRAGHVTGQCPFCDKEGKWSANEGTGQWDCKSCTRSGNLTEFLRALWELSGRATLEPDLATLAADRGLLSPKTLVSWGIRKSPLTHEWLVPGHSPDGRLMQLYRYATPKGGGKRLLLAGPGKALGHRLFGVPLLRKEHRVVFLCEGPWDAMALWEALRGGGVAEAAGLDGPAGVLAVPGCGTFAPAWARLFAGKDVVLLYDNDHPRVHAKTGESVPPAGWNGCLRTAKLLDEATPPVASIRLLQWGEGGYDPGLPAGHDVRDFLKPGRDRGERAELLGMLLNRLTLFVRSAPAPPRRQGPAPSANGHAGPNNRPGELLCLPCKDWATMVNAWRKAMRWNEGLDRALSVMLATITSTPAVGDQLWMKIVGPPSCGKSVLCEALSVNKRFVLAKSTIRGFHSGFQADAAGEVDCSLLVACRNKTLITKDGDTLLQAPNKDQILSEARDVYDRTSRTHYRNKMSKDYEGYPLTWLLCGTESLRALDASELGERFLDCVIIDEIDEDEEDAVGWRVANRVERQLNLVADSRPETLDGPEMTLAKQLTGGYVGHLRDNGQRLLEATLFPEHRLRECQRLARFVAFMRARPSLKQDEKTQRELSYRLISQLVRLAKCLAVVLNRPAVDGEVMRRVAQSARDTARGRTYELCRHLAREGERGAETKALAVWTGHSEEKERTFLQFLKRLKAIEPYQPPPVHGVRPRPRWKLSERLQTLFEEIVPGLIPNSNEKAH